MALLNASGQYQLGGMLISLVANLLLTKINVPEIDLSLKYSWIIDEICDRLLFNVFAKAKKILCRAYIKAVLGSISRAVLNFPMQ